ncbi:AhpC/TSA family protein [Salibacteraceae bacterium]|jgi:peroxiredoxin|nr:AhpC/TSA family protein [Bacteroidota bacterium]MDA9938330.1 AhpC/TSA family protein [Salibacteraceae bacterium]MDB0058500.1 AhpC/TSA family protein [Salibacteraceae bacterium]MDB9724890.1 AhpC/TSA family protein [Salibacteraceae bacterium]
MSLKNLSVTFLIVMLFSLVTSAAKKEKTSVAKKYQFEFTISDSDDSLVFLANYYGKKQYYYDTAFAVEKGKFKFETDSIPGGIYLIVMPDKSQYFEIVVSGTEPSVVLSTTRANMVGDMKVSVSEENKLFYEFQQEMSKKGEQAAPIQKKIQALKADTVNPKVDEIKAEQEKLEAVNKEVNEFKKQFINTHKGTFTAKLFLTSQEPDVPENPELPEGTNLDLWKFQEYKRQYLENVDFTDERLLRSPVFAKKLEYYMTKLVIQMPDSITKAADELVARTRPNKEMFKYVVHWNTNHFERSKIMGMDGVFVHMSDNYYTKEQAHWVDSAGLAKINDRAATLRPLLLGKVASNIILPDTTGKWHDLHKLPAEYTILYFWSPTCGHCKKSTPKLESFYKDYKSKGIEVFGVCTELETDGMKTFVKTHKLTFINVSDTPEINKNAYDYLDKTTVNSLNFRTIYDIYSTPQVYVLDKNKKIIAKKLGVEQLADFIDNYSKDKGSN